MDKKEGLSDFAFVEGAARFGRTHCIISRSKELLATASVNQNSWKQNKQTNHPHGLKTLGKEDHVGRSNTGVCGGVY